MADDLTLPATAAVVATDEVDMGSGTPSHVQLVKIVDATDGSSARVPGSAARGLAVDPRPKVERITANTITVSTTNYAALDSIGGEVVFPNAVRAAGGTGVIVRIAAIDLSKGSKGMDLHFFDRALASAPADNAAFDPADADLANYLGKLSVSPGHYALFTDNSAADVPAGLPIKCNGTSLYCYPVFTDSPATFSATTDFSLVAFIAQD